MIKSSRLSQWKRREIQRFHSALNDFSALLPLMHGTSEYYVRRIRKDGLCPRAFTNEKSVWDTMPSRMDGVYFGTCNNDIVETSSKYAEQASQSKFAAEEPIVMVQTPYGKFRREPEQQLYAISLRDPYKYRDRFLTDEDERFEKLLRKSFYDANFVNQYVAKPSTNIDKSFLGYIQDVFACRTFPPKAMLHLDRLWVACGIDCIQEAIQSLPEYLKSLYSSRSIAVKGCIPPRDLKIRNMNTIDQWCTQEMPFEGFCLPHEYRLKTYINKLLDARVPEPAKIREAMHDLRHFILHTKFKKWEQKKLGLNRCLYIPFSDGFFMSDIFNPLRKIADALEQSENRFLCDKESANRGKLRCYGDVGLFRYDAINNRLNTVKNRDMLPTISTKNDSFTFVSPNTVFPTPNGFSLDFLNNNYKVDILRDTFGRDANSWVFSGKMTEKDERDRQHLLVLKKES